MLKRIIFLRDFRYVDLSSTYNYLRSPLFHTLYYTGFYIYTHMNSISVSHNYYTHALITI